MPANPTLPPACDALSVAPNSSLAAACRRRICQTAYPCAPYVAIQEVQDTRNSTLRIPTPPTAQPCLQVPAQESKQRIPAPRARGNLRATQTITATRKRRPCCPRTWTAISKRSRKTSPSQHDLYVFQSALYTNKAEPEVYCHQQESSPTRRKGDKSRTVPFRPPGASATFPLNQR